MSSQDVHCAPAYLAPLVLAGVRAPAVLVVPDAPPFLALAVRLGIQPRFQPVSTRRACQMRKRYLRVCCCISSGDMEV